MPTHKPIVYVAGPYSANPTHCTTRAAITAMAIFEAGDFIPMLPHLSHHWDAITPQPYTTWLEIDLGLLHGCDFITRMPGKSSGADGEMAYAEQIGLPVIEWDTWPQSVKDAYASVPDFAFAPPSVA